MVEFPDSWPRTVLLEQPGEYVSQRLWVDENEQNPLIFKLTQRWDDGDEATIYLLLHELEDIASAARDCLHPPSRGASIQQWEEYLDAMEAHDDATV
jgi:hypothetical protein